MQIILTPACYCSQIAPLAENKRKTKQQLILAAQGKEKNTQPICANDCNTS